MFLSKTTEYAFIAVGSMLEYKGKDFMTVYEIADATKIPRHYLSKVMKLMVDNGLIVAKKGHHGGFVFAKKLDKITFLDIIRSIGGRNREPAFASGKKQSSSNSASIFTSLNYINTLIYDWASKTTLQDIKSGKG